MAKANNVTSYHIEPLRKDNFDTWRIQAQAILIKHGLWGYVSGKLKKPEDPKALVEYEEQDFQARADLLLIISPSELRQVKNTVTSKELWELLLNIYESRGPARKASLLKQLITAKMGEGQDVREHINNFIDIVDKLHNMDININEDLLSIMMLYSLPRTFENFRVAIESRDSLPKPADLKVKIIEEFDARKNMHTETEQEEEVMYTKKKFFKKGFKNGNKSVQCTHCKKFGHHDSDCWSKKKQTNQKSFVATTKERALTFTEKKKYDKFCIDSGCTSHMTYDKDLFDVIYKVDEKKLNLASIDKTEEIIGKGTVRFSNTKGEVFNIANTLYVPSLSTNLISVAKLTDKQYSVLFDEKCATVKDKQGEIVLKAKKEDGLYYMDIQHVNKQEKSYTASELFKWHVNLGHVNETDLKQAYKNNAVRGLDFDVNEKLEECEACIQGKMSRLPFPEREQTKVSKVLEIIHTDVCGPMPVESNGGNKYFVTFIDEFSRYCRVYFLKSKNEVLQKFKEYKEEVEKSTGSKIIYLQSDNGTEYRNKEFDIYLKRNGIARRLSAPYTPQQNGMAERKNRTLLDKARCMLIQSQAPEKFWADAILNANYVTNRTATKTTNYKTPFERWAGYVPSVKHLHAFGAKAFVLNKNKRRKFAPKTKEGIFLGYSENHKAYRLWLPNQNRLYVSRDIKVLNKMYFKNEKEEKDYLHVESERYASEPKETIEIDIENFSFQPLQQSPRVNDDAQDEDDVYDECEAVEDTQEPCRPHRNTKAPSWQKDYEMSYFCDYDQEYDESSAEWQKPIKGEIKTHLKNKYLSSKLGLHNVKKRNCSYLHRRIACEEECQ